MTHTTEITLITANILAGGIGRSRSEKRFDAILELLAAQDGAAIAIQEALYWHEEDFALLHRAEQILGLRGVLAIEPRGMDIALFVGGPLALRSSRGITATPWRHGAVHARAALPDGQILTLGSVHLSPRAPEQRLAEAQSISTWWDPDGLTVVMGDYNGPDHDTDLSTVRPEIRARLALPGTATPDTRGPDHLAAVGFIDLATRATDARTPTTGHGRDVETRCDRILASPDAAQIASKTVLIDTGDLSDHDWLSTTLSVPPRPETGPLDAADAPNATVGYALRTGHRW